MTGEVGGDGATIEEDGGAGGASQGEGGSGEGGGTGGEGETEALGVMEDGDGEGEAGEEEVVGTVEGGGKARLQAGRTWTESWTTTWPEPSLCSISSWTIMPERPRRLRIERKL